MVEERDIEKRDDWKDQWLKQTEEIHAGLAENVAQRIEVMQITQDRDLWKDMNAYAIEQGRC